MFDFNDREMVINKLEELKTKNIPHMTYQKLSETYTLQASEEEIEAIDAYFKKYCEAGYNEGKDIFSDEDCSFYWGLSHGEMVTNDNGMDRTQYHYLTVDGKRTRFGLLLQYHPDNYIINESEEC